MKKKKQEQIITAGDRFPNAQLKFIEQDDEKRKFMAKCVSNSLAFFNIGMTPVTSDEELCERLNFYFESCARTQQLPTIEKMLLCLGLNRRTFDDWCLGGGFTANTNKILEKARGLISSIDAELAAEGKIQSVVYIFRAKNYYGMQDKTDVAIAPAENLTTMTAEDVAKKYQELPSDYDSDYDSDCD